MALIEFKTDLTDSQLRQFAWLWFPIGGGLLGALIWFRLGLPTVAIGLWSIVALTVLLGIAKPAAVRPVFFGLMCLAFPIGWVMSHVVLGAVYYLCITPIGFLMRTLYKDPMQRKLEPESGSYWEPHKQETDPSRYFRQF